MIHVSHCTIYWNKDRHSTLTVSLTMLATSQGKTHDTHICIKLQFIKQCCQLIYIFQTSMGAFWKWGWFKSKIATHSPTFQAAPGKNHKHPPWTCSWVSTAEKSNISLIHGFYHIVHCCCCSCRLSSSSNHFWNLSCRIKVLHADPRATIFLFFVLRRGRICLLHDIDGDSEFKDKAHQFRLFLLTFSSLSLVFIWHFYAKVLS